MANNFNRYPAKDVGTTASSLFTVPAATKTTLIGVSCANTSISPVTVDVYITISGVDYYITKGATVAVGGAFVPVGGDMKVVMVAGDILKVKSSAAASVDAIASVLEIS